MGQELPGAARLAKRSVRRGKAGERHGWVRSSPVRLAEGSGWAGAGRLVPGLDWIGKAGEEQGLVEWRGAAWRGKRRH